MSALSPPTNKIPDEALRRFASSDSEDRAGVLIELNLSEPQVRLELRQSSGGPSRWRPAEVLGESAATTAENERKAEETRRFLEDVLGTSPRWLRYAHAYSADVTPSQLSRIVEAPNVLAVHPNRRIARDQGY